jgi:hypothetical protein
MFGRPTLHSKPEADGNYTLRVVSVMGDITDKIVTADELGTIVRWYNGEGHIQDALPHWSVDDRELLISGIPPGEFEKRLGLSSE